MEGYQILLLVAHQTKYADFPLWIRISKRIRQKLIENFNIILLMIDKPWWINKLVLRMSEWCPTLYEKHLEKVRFKFHSILEYCSNNIAHKDFIVSGGSLSQIIHEKSWISDLDLFYFHHVNSVNYRKKICGIDFVPQIGTHIQKVILGFDCSLVQVSVGVDDEIYFTPSFLLSLITKKAYWTTVGTDFYHEQEGFRHDYDMILLDIFNIKCDHSLCIDCENEDCVPDILFDHDPSRSTEIRVVWKKWFDRMKKYKKRFPEFQFEMLNLKKEKQEEEEPKQKKIKK